MSAADAVSSSWEARHAQTMATWTVGFASIHAIAVWGRLMPRSRAKALSRSTTAVVPAERP